MSRLKWTRARDFGTNISDSSQGSDETVVQSRQIYDLFQSISTLLAYTKMKDGEFRFRPVAPIFLFVVSNA